MAQSQYFVSWVNKPLLIRGDFQIEIGKKTFFCT